MPRRLERLLAWQGGWEERGLFLGSRRDLGVGGC